MAKRWIGDPALLDSLSDNLIGTMSMFPKRLIRVDELVHACHMPLSHIQIMTLLDGRDLSIGQLSERLGVAKPNITPMVDALHDRGYVSRIHKSEDRRVVHVHLEPEGDECLNRIKGIVSDQISQWPMKLSKSEVRLLNKGLGMLIRLMEGMNEQPADKG